MPWRAGDFLTLPSGCTTSHRADPVGEDDGATSALLYRVTDAPLLRYLGATPTRPRFAPTRFDGDAALARLAEVAQDPDAADRSRVSVLLGNTATPQTLTVTHTLWAMLGILPAGRCPAAPPTPERGPRPHHGLRSGLLFAARPPARR